MTIILPNINTLLTFYWDYLFSCLQCLWELLRESELLLLWVLNHKLINQWHSYCLFGLRNDYSSHICDFNPMLILIPNTLWWSNKCLFSFLLVMALIGAKYILIYNCHSSKLISFWVSSCSLLLFVWDLKKSLLEFIHGFVKTMMSDQTSGQKTHSTCFLYFILSIFGHQ